MKGFTLLEAVVAMSFVLVMLLCGYEALTAEQNLFQFAISRTRFESESNYRIASLKAVFENCSESLRNDLYLQRAPYFFPNISLQPEANPVAFCVARPAGAPVRFQKEGSALKTAGPSGLSPDDFCLIAGLSASTDYVWNYARVSRVDHSSSYDSVWMQMALEKSALEKGTLIKVDLHGILFQRNEIFWIGPSGQLSPFLSPIEEFRYEWKQPLLKLYWRTAEIAADFRVKL